MMEIQFHVHKNAGIPVYLQLEQQIRLLIHRGLLAAGMPMPTVRQLAVDLGINSNTVARVYRELQREGILELRRGVGSFVADNARTKPLPQRDWEGLEDRVGELIQTSKALGLTPAEVVQLIETRWKESPDV